MRRTGLLFLLTMLVTCCTSPIRSEDPLQWSIKTLTVDGNEGCDVADFNNDGRLDIIAGRNWYAGPDFIPRPVRTIEDWNGYVESNGDFAYDVDGDGWTDVIAGSFLPTQVHWFKNPGEEALRLGKMWEKRLLVDTHASTNEAQLFQDMDDDGRPEWIVNSWQKDKPMLIWQLAQKAEEKPAPTLKAVELGPLGSGHGLGVGDISGDGKPDVLVGQGWYEHPSEGGLAGKWKFHPEWDMHASIPILVTDLDGDGRNDLIVGQGHDFGLHWWRQLPPSDDGRLQWEKHLIDEEYSQPHALHLADLDGDGAAELISGKRWYAHNGGDPGGQMPPGIYYYTWDRAGLKFTRQIIERGSVGTGLQIRTADLNADSKLDIVVAGKSGTFAIINGGK